MGRVRILVKAYSDVKGFANVAGAGMRTSDHMLFVTQDNPADLVPGFRGSGIGFMELVGDSGNRSLHGARGPGLPDHVVRDSGPVTLQAAQDLPAIRHIEGREFRSTSDWWAA